MLDTTSDTVGRQVAHLFLKFTILTYSRALTSFQTVRFMLCW